MARRQPADEGLPELPPEAGSDHDHDEMPPGTIPLRAGGGQHDLGLGMGGMGGMGYSQMREVRIPIWEDAGRFNNGAYRVSVSRITPEGVQSSLGFMHAGATEDEVIARGQGKPGTYLIMPVDENGETLRASPYRRTVDEEHPAVLRYHRGASAGAAHSGVAMMHAGSPGVDPEMLGFFQSVLSAKDAEKDEMLAYMREKDAEIARVREETSKMQLAVATSHTKSALEVQQQILDADRARQDFLQKQQLALLERQQLADRERQESEASRNQSFYQAMLQQTEKAAQAERERRADEMRRAEADLARREAQMREDEKRREAWMREQEAARQERAERERARDREHMELVIKMLEKQNEVADPFKNVASLLEKGSALKELVPALFGGDSGPQGIMGMVTTLMTEGMKTFTEIQKIQMQNGDDDDEIDLTQVPMTPEIYAQLQAAGQLPPQLQMQNPPVDPAATAAAEQEAEMRARMARAFGGSPAPAPQAPPPAPAPQASDISPIEAAPNYVLPPSDLVHPPAVAKLEPIVRKKAREAIRELVAAIRAVPETQWQATITQGIMKTPQVIPYISAATIRGALIEGGADEPLAQRIIDAIDKTGLVPSSIPRG